MLWLLLYHKYCGKHSCIILFESYPVRYTGRLPAKDKWEVLENNTKTRETALRISFPAYFGL